MRRRDALKHIGALAGAGAAARLLPGCGDDIGSGAPEGGITTLVVVCMENRSYDHYLGARALLGLPGDGLTAGMSNPDPLGGEVATYHETTFCVPDPPHSWDGSRECWNDGAMDGFLRAYRARRGDDVAPHVMGRFERDDIPVTWAIADAHASCDRWFSSLLGPTWPNRMYLHSGQSGGLRTNDFPAVGGIPWPSIHHRLTDAGIGWAYYYQDLPFVPLFMGVDLDSVHRFDHDFFDDAEAGRLPPVVFVEPAFTFNDDHPPHHPMFGQQFLATVYRTLAASPQWNHCMLVVTYDEAGGFFDHVPPPLAADDRAAEGFDQLGFRVPTLVAGPYVKAGHVSSVVRDHTSVLAHIDAMHGLEPLSTRAATAATLDELIDQDRLERRDPAPPAELPAVEIDESTVDERCGAGAVRRRHPTDLERLADAGFFAPHLDRRRTMRDTIHAIGEQLDRLGGGRIRRGR
jgi:phospholipase C